MKNKSTTRHVRALILAMFIAAAIAALGAGSASAATALTVTTDNNQVMQDTAVTITTALTGTGTARKQYGANIVMPPALPLRYYNTDAGTDARCSANGAFSTVSTGLGNVTAFNNSQCLPSNIIGTASIGSITGKIYAVSASPLTRIGVYFDSGTATPFGREIVANWANSAVTLNIKGLPNTSTNGLTLTFNNPGRGAGLNSKVFAWIEPGMTGCVKNPQVTGSSYHWPTLVLPGSTFSTVNASAATLTLNGCDFNFFAQANGAQQPLDNAPLLTQSMIYNGSKQYGQTIDLPRNIYWSFPVLGGPACPSTANQPLTTGLTPTAGSFNPTGCPAGSQIGTATLGTQTGKIYLVAASPTPQMGIWFDTGVSPAYGRRLNMFTSSDPTRGIQLQAFGLNGAANAGLKLNFTPPAGQQYLFYLAPGGTSDCGTKYAKSTIYTYPASGTAATANGPLTARNPISETGC